MPKQPNVITTQQGQFPPWMQALRHAVDQNVTADDLDGIVKAFVEKAKKGDEKAARFVIDYLMGGKLAPQQVTINNHFQTDPDRKPSPVSDAIPCREQPLKERIYVYLEAAGPTKAKKIAQELDLPLALIQPELENEWFTESSGTWRIAKAGDRRP